jgi:hypothetical protein
MILINRFGQNFVQNHVEFHGGGRGIKIQAIRGARMLFPRHYAAAAFFPHLHIEYVTIRVQNKSSSPYITATIIENILCVPDPAVGIESVLGAQSSVLDFQTYF